MHGYLIDSKHILADAQPLPNNGSIASTYDIEIGNNDNRLELLIFAGTDITVPAEKSFSIELFCSADGSDFDPPVPGTHLYLLHKTAADPELNLDAGELIYAAGLAKNYASGYLRLVFKTDADLSATSLDAFVRTVR